MKYLIVSCSFYCLYVVYKKRGFYNRTKCFYVDVDSKLNLLYPVHSCVWLYAISRSCAVKYFDECDIFEKAMDLSLRVHGHVACRAGEFWAGESCCLCSYCSNRHLCYDGRRLGRVKIVTLRVGVRAKEGKRGGGGEKKLRLPDIIVLLGNSVR